MIEHRFCYVFDVFEDALDLYEAAHNDIPPEIPRAMRSAGVTTFSLFRRGALVVASGTCSEPPDIVFARLDEDPDNVLWSKRIRALMPDPLDEHGRLRFADEIWRLPEPEARTEHVERRPSDSSKGP